MQEVQLEKTLTVVARAWLFAETTLQDRSAKFFPDPDEKEVTSKFHECFAERLTQVNRQGAISRAFLQDLQNAVPDVPDHDLETEFITRQLVADVTLHDEFTEGKTTGDLGIVIARPLIRLQETAFLVEQRSLHGILAQAKIRQRKTKKWGPFSPTQKSQMGKHLPYLTLLLYDFEDQDRMRLAPFKWQLCASARSFSQVKTWVTKDDFPCIQGSDDIIAQLGSGQLGTQDNAVIEQYISPMANRCLVITIGWPDGRGPASWIEVAGKTQATREVKLYVRGS
jgi:hypothetical protein